MFLTSSSRSETNSIVAINTVKCLYCCAGGLSVRFLIWLKFPSVFSVCFNSLAYLAEILKFHADCIFSVSFNVVPALWCRTNPSAGLGGMFLPCVGVHSRSLRNNHSHKSLSTCFSCADVNAYMLLFPINNS